MTFALEMQSVRDESDSDCRSTRTALFREFDAEFRFTFDVAATPELAKTPRFWTKEDDGLSKVWAGERVWCNPPWSDIAPWVRKAEFETFGGCELVAMLLPVRTDQDWWQERIEPYRDGHTPSSWVGRLPRIETRFLPGRIKFGCPGDPEGLLSGSPNFWCVLVIWRGR